MARASRPTIYYFVCSLESRRPSIEAAKVKNFSNSCLGRRLLLIDPGLQSPHNIPRGRFQNAEQAGDGSLDKSDNLGAEDFDRGEISQGEQLGLTEPLIVQIAELDLQLVEF